MTYARRPPDNYALRRRAEQQERRRAGLLPENRPRERRDTRTPDCQSYAAQLLPALPRITAPPMRPGARCNSWTREQDEVMVRALARGCSASQAAEKVKALRPSVTSHAVARRIRVLWAMYGPEAA